MGRVVGVGAVVESSRRRAAAALVGAALLAPWRSAGADDALSAPRYVRRSTTLYLSSMWSFGPTVPVRLGADGALRGHRGGLAIEVRLGGGSAGSVNALSAILTGHAGASIGGAIAIGDRVAIVPMLGYDVFRMWERDGASFAVHAVTLEVPVAIVLRRGVVLEPFLQIGVARYHGTDDPLLVVGPRIGIVL